MKKTILVSAYAVNPFKGSEDGTGWNISKQLAKEYKVVIVTRNNNRPEIERYLAENTESVFDNMTFLYHDLPKWAMRLKKKLGERGYVLYFYFWQMFLPAFIRKSKIKLDLSYALNFHSDSTPQFLWRLGKPVIWGPIGHHPKTPAAYLKHHSVKVQLTDALYGSVKWAMRNLDPFFYLAKNRTEKIIAINSSVQGVMRVSSEKVIVIPAVGSDPVIVSDKQTSQFNVLSVGRFTAMKGFDIAVLAFARFYKSLPKNQQSRVKLTLVGKGEGLEDLKKLIMLHALNQAVEIISWVPKIEMQRIYSNASAFIFPSHEGAGMVVPEAMSYGLPVICFDNVGPGELAGDAGIKIPYSTYNQSVNSFAEHLFKLFQNENWAMEVRKRSLNRFIEHFTWKAKGEAIRSIVNEVLEDKKTIIVFHPSAELYGADRILVNALNAIPKEVNKRVYLFRGGPLVDFMKSHVNNVEVIIKPEMPVIYRKIFNPIGMIVFMSNWVRFLFYLRRENKKYNFASAYVNTLSVSFLLPILAMLGIKRFVHVHEIIDTPKMVGKVTAWLSFKFANKIVCVSNAVFIGLKRYVAHIDRKVEVIHNGIDAIEVVPNDSKEGLNFYLFGRIKPEKGQWFLIEALSLIPIDKLANSQFILMGGAVSGQEQMVEDLREKIVAAGLDNNVQIEGFSPCIASAMSDADVCLVPSIMKDPFPTTVLEAMSAAKTVITTNHGGAKEAVINNETGFLIEPNNSQQFAEVLTHVIDQKEELSKWGENAKNRYQEFFTTDSFNRNWTQFNLSNQFL
ncbi:MAG: glycosyltransferase involved in cell wall biosynthesis [Salibacteraceae bacterium]|jgi:glycosyltransferase involved in cell wall biosynthesis